MRSHSALNSTFNSSALLLLYTPVCFHTECRISAFWQVRFKKRSKIEQKDIITPMHCLAFPSALFGAPFHIDNRTVANCGFWLEYASKTPLEVGADLPRRMRLFWLRCQIMRLRSVHIKPHYSQNAFDSALLAWYERGISFIKWVKCNSSEETHKKTKLFQKIDESSFTLFECYRNVNFKSNSRRSLSCHNKPSCTAAGIAVDIRSCALALRSKQAPRSALFRCHPTLSALPVL